MDQARLSQALAAAVAAGGPDAALAVCRACVDWLPMTGVSITMMAGAEVQEPICATDAVSTRIDELQFSPGDGPCVESFRARAFSTASTITEVADDVVARRLRLRPDGGWRPADGGLSPEHPGDDPVDPPGRDDEETS